MNGADVNARCGLFGNALQAAVASDNEEVVQLLQNNGAQLDPRGPNWKALLASIQEAIVEDRYGYDVPIYDPEGVIKRLKRFQQPRGTKLNPEDQSESDVESGSETQSEFEAQPKSEAESGSEELSESETHWEFDSEFSLSE
jgi:hypothetical protein